MKSFQKMTASLLMLTMAMAEPLFAAPLAYEGNQGMDPGGAYPASGPVSPVNYGTTYENQYSPYASFMQSPYQQGNGSYSGGPGSPMGGGNGGDPFGASEVSPYAHYSPYMEIIGEGSDYTLGIDDVVTIIVRNQPDFSGRFVVDPEGNIQYNFVGDIPAIGRTKEELKVEIMERLKKFVRYPEAAVMISDYRSKHIYVFGKVNRPGKYAMKGNKITVKEAMVAAGLPTDDAALGRVYVIRPSEFTETGEAEKMKVDVKQLLRSGDSAEDFFLEPGDTIIVNQRYYDKFVNNFSRLVGPLFQAAAVYELGYGQNNGFLRKDK